MAGAGAGTGTGKARGTIFTERDPERFRAELERYGIDYVLVPARPQGSEFNGANYPESFLVCANALVGRGEMAVVWKGSGLGLLRLGPQSIGPAP